MPEDKEDMLQIIKSALHRDEKSFREVFIGTE